MEVLLRETSVRDWRVRGGSSLGKLELGTARFIDRSCS